jgi:hypothetical protein
MVSELDSRVCEATWFGKRLGLGKLARVGSEPITHTRSLALCKRTSKYQKLVSVNLMRLTEICPRPHIASIDNKSPGILSDVIGFNSAQSWVILISPSESKDVVVIENSKTSARARFVHASDFLPFIIDDVISFTRRSELLVCERSNCIDVIPMADERMVCSSV